MAKQNVSNPHMRSALEDRGFTREQVEGFRCPIFDSCTY
jgi:hypothetical protein